MKSIAPLLLVAALLGGCVSQEHDNSNLALIPMYGQPENQRSETLKKADADFIAKATAAFGGDRKAASIEWAKAAENFFEAGKNIPAMLRYNQAWLLDPDNYRVYWGYGRIMQLIDEHDDSIKYMRQAIALCSDNYQLTGIYSDLGIVFVSKAKALPSDSTSERNELFAEADAAMEKSIQLNPNYGNNWRAWCISLVYQGRYKEASDKLSKAQELGANKLPDFVEQKLSAGLALE